jgi:hypothetical protein
MIVRIDKIDLKRLFRPWAKSFLLQLWWYCLNSEMNLRNCLFLKWLLHGQNINLRNRDIGFLIVTTKAFEFEFCTKKKWSKVSKTHKNHHTI